jgi:hypothetical protein
MRFAATLATLALIGGSWPGAAVADGDPASDVLAAQPLFLAQDAGLTASQQAELGALLSVARRSGYQLRVAVIAGPTDLGSITELWRQPESYARFLGQELSLVYRGTLLVVMPNGFGLYGAEAKSAAARAALASGRPAGPGPALGAATIAAVRRLATADGHPLRVAAVTAGGPASPSDYAAMVALGVGALLIAAAWLASFRARPLGTRAAGP